MGEPDSNMRLPNHSTFAPDARIGLLGANGNGKSTLVKLLSNTLSPMAGELHKSGKLRVGYFAQFQTDELDVDLTPYEIMRAARKGVPEAKIRAQIGAFGFDKFKADTKVGELSGGEKARLLFCLMSFDAPHIMLLDEPTNHLDIDAREALQKALNNYNGAVILVSHDTHLVECVADRLWLVADGTCKPYDGDLEDYRKLVVDQRKKEREQEKKKGKKEKDSPAAVEKEAHKLEAKIAELRARKDALENEIANVCANGDAKQLKDLNITFSQVEKQLAEQTQLLDELISKMV